MIPFFQKSYFLLLVVTYVVLAVCVIFFNWSVHELLLFFWFESVFIGLVNTLKIIAVSLLGDPYGRHVGADSRFSALCTSLLIVLFFLFKFGGLVFFLGFFICTLPAFFENSEMELSGIEIMNTVQSSLESIIYFAPALMLIYLYFFVRYFIFQKEYRELSIFGLLFSPYKRILALYVTLVFGVLGAALSPSGFRVIVFSVVVLLGRLFFDIRLLQKRFPEEV